jgi:hypothetical protein
MSDLSFKFQELTTIQALVEIQLDTLTHLEDINEDPDQKKFIKNELGKIKPLKTKIGKLIKSY